MFNPASDPPSPNAQGGSSSSTAHHLSDYEIQRNRNIKRNEAEWLAIKGDYEFNNFQPQLKRQKVTTNGPKKEILATRTSPRVHEAVAGTKQTVHAVTEQSDGDLIEDSNKRACARCVTPLDLRVIMRKRAPHLSSHIGDDVRLKFVFVFFNVIHTVPLKQIS